MTRVSFCDTDHSLAFPHSFTLSAERCAVSSFALENKLSARLTRHRHFHRMK